MITNGLPAPLNITLVAGVEKTIEVQVSALDGSFRDMSYYTYDGKAEGVDGKVYALQAWVEGDSPDVVLVRFPALAEGRYRWMLTATAEDGEAASLLSGTLGVHWPQVKAEKGKVSSPNRRLVVRYPDANEAGVARWEYTGWLDAAVDDAQEAGKRAVEAAARLSVVDDKLEQAEALKNAFNGKIHESVIPSATTGTWIVGGVDTGKPYQGGDGKDADEIKRYVVSSILDLPAKGNDGEYYYVENEATAATGWVFFVNSPGGNGDYLMTIGGTNIYINTSDANLADTINAAQNQVTAIADSADERVITLLANKAGEAGNSIAISLGENVSREEISGGTLTGGQDAGLVPYAWVYRNGVGQWLAVSTTAEKISAEYASISRPGSVRLTYSVNTSYSDVPTSNAVKLYVDSAVNECVKATELEGYATKEEIEGLVTEEEINGLASEQYVDQAIAELDISTYSKSESDERFLSKGEAEATYIRTNAGYPRIEVLDRAAFDALPVRDPSVIYFIKKQA